MFKDPKYSDFFLAWGLNESSWVTEKNSNLTQLLEPAYKLIWTQEFPWWWFWLFCLQPCPLEFHPMSRAQTLPLCFKGSLWAPESVRNWHCVMMVSSWTLRYSSDIEMVWWPLHLGIDHLQSYIENQATRSRVHLKAIQFDKLQEEAELKSLPHFPSPSRIPFLPALRYSWFNFSRLKSSPTGSTNQEDVTIDGLSTTSWIYIFLSSWWSSKCSRLWDQFFGVHVHITSQYLPAKSPNLLQLYKHTRPHSKKKKEKKSSSRCLSRHPLVGFHWPAIHFI